MVSKRNRVLIRRHGGKVMPFRKLPPAAQLAIAHYMAINGDAWDLPWEPARMPVRTEEIRRMMPFFLEEYGDEPFGLVNIPTQALVEAVSQDDFFAGEWASFEEYHAWYVSHGGVPHHPKTNRWPVILSSFEDETLQDGWHRFHSYYEQGARTIPAVYYP